MTEPIHLGRDEAELDADIRAAEAELSFWRVQMGYEEQHRVARRRLDRLVRLKEALRYCAGLGPKSTWHEREEQPELSFRELDVVRLANELRAANERLIVLEARALASEVSAQRTQGAGRGGGIAQGGEADMRHYAKLAVLWCLWYRFQRVHLGADDDSRRGRVPREPDDTHFYVEAG